MNAVERLTVTSARCMRSLKCISPDSSNSVVDSFSRINVSHVMNAQLLPCVHNCNIECKSFSESLGNGVWLQILYFTLESSFASFLHWVLFFLNKRWMVSFTEILYVTLCATEWWQTLSYLCYCDAIVEHFKAVFELSWDGQTHVDRHFLKTQIVDLFKGK